jgi:hypothetical protein
MPLDRNPVHRRLIVPWYDADAACWLMIVVMAPVLLFGLQGVAVARTVPAWRTLIGVPLALVGLSALVMGANLVRLLRRFLDR